MLRYPLLYLTGHLPVRFTDAEQRHVRQFVDRGGLLFVDDHNHDIDGTFHKTATEEITRAVGPLVELPNDHPLYSVVLQVRWTADDEPRAQWLGRQPRSQAPARRPTRRTHRGPL